MATVCTCKGIRVCLKCEDEKKEQIQLRGGPKTLKSWFYCPECKDRAFRTQLHSEHLAPTTDYLSIPGVLVLPDFISESEENYIMSHMDRIPWVSSQSGRRKHDFGPKVNFKKKKIKTDSFDGFPSFSKFILGRMQNVPELATFRCAEMCDLDYLPENGAAIDPHFDDFWLWGERLVTLNLLSDTKYRLTKPDSFSEISIDLPRRSLIVLYSEARFVWMHAIRRQDITERRVGITLRELTEEFREGGIRENIGNDLYGKARIFVNF